MTFVYPAIFHKENNSYWVEFPDLEGCQTYGDTIPEAMENAQEALQGYLLTLFEDGSPFASPSVMSKFKTENDDFASLVSCTLSSPAKPVKKTLTIPAWLNDKAVSQGINFSQTLQEALLERIAAYSENLK